MRKQVLVSVIIPCYNQGPWLKDALKSVAASCYEKIETIVVDDGSTDETTLEVIKDIELKDSVRVLRQANQGVCAARNVAVAMARGEFILPLDGDDLLEPTFISKAMALFGKYPELGGVGGNCMFFDGRGASSAMNDLPSGFVGHGVMANMFLTVTTVFRKEVWKRVGGFSMDFNRVALEDVYFTMKAHAIGVKAYYLSDIGCRYRQHGESRNNHSNRRRLAKMMIFRRLFGWYLSHPRFILPFLLWSRFKWMVRQEDFINEA